MNKLLISLLNGLYLTKKQVLFVIKRPILSVIWWARQESNLRPGGYEPLALTAELRARSPAEFPPTGALERVTGFEPVNVSLEG